MTETGFHRLPKRVQQALWFVGIWCASIVTLSIVAYVIRAAIMP